MSGLRSIGFAASLLALSVPGPSLARDNGVLPVGADVGDQDISPFYRWNKPLPVAPGRVLREEPLPASLTPRQAASATRILYTSTDVRWNSGILPVSGVLYMPRGKRPRGGWPLVVWSHGTLGVADSCAPSWTGSNTRDRGYIARWLDDGFAVVAPDYQGLGGPGPHPYTLWQAEGRSVLDAGRAALRMNRGIANRVIITGQSQGSGASLGAAQLAASYAPDLAVKGAIATALVPSFADDGAPANLPSPGGSPYYMVYRLMSGSLPNGSPPAEHYLSDKGRILLAAARTQCSPRVVAEANAITMENAFSMPPEQVDAALGPIGRMQPFRTRFPLMLGVGLADELISPERQSRAVKAICKSGNKVVFKGYAEARHSDTLTRSASDAIAFARSVLSGGAVQSDCDSL